MEKIRFNGEFFNIKDTLSCGQVFRFSPTKNGYKVFSADKCAIVYNDGDFTVIETEDGESEYFTHYFDLERDYSVFFNAAQNEKEEILRVSSSAGKGIRILNQNKEETLFSFIISQNNNIPRIKGIIEKLCLSLGEKKFFNGEEYFTFPSAEKMASCPLEFFYQIGLGYRAPFIKRLADDINSGYSIDFPALSVKEELLKIYGVGEKVADCVSFFGYRRTDSFPVDVWIEKVYRENFNGTEKDRKKIAKYFSDRFKEYSGYFQQYLFYYKRSLEKTAEKQLSKTR